ncbi:hypothetical protein PN36_08340 [Candidatus Thiomargarita nelsonii]|uniref:CopG family transcriptional regulator n=1 Tax=Candidatus Thiomargarita nelsonii TaxID=1003181 RepID=A0A4E0RK27_9GAMM|nr:hypothetical protein PN36_08340 [Candidatus Thiomargarita nelsonii]
MSFRRQDKSVAAPIVGALDFPIWMFQSLDKEAKRLGVTQQSIIKVWIAERLEKVRYRRLE